MAYTKEQVELLKESQQLMKLIGLDMDYQADIQDKILTGQLKSLDAMEEAVESARQQNIELSKTAKLEAEIKESKQDIKDLSDGLKKSITYISSLTEDTLETELKKVAAAKKLGVLTDDQAARYEDTLKTFAKLAANPVVKQGFKEASDTIEGMQAGIDGFMKKMPGGELLSKSLGLDKFSEKLQMSIMQGGKLGFLGVIAAAGILFAILKSISDEAKKLSAETGLTFGQAMKLNNEMREASTAYSVTLATQEDLVAVQKASIAEFGNAAILSGEVAASVAETGKAFGYGALEAGKVNAEFMQMGLSGAKAADAQQDLAASALKAGVNVGAVMKDISTNAKNVAKYFGGNVQALKNAAIEAQKLGMSLETMGKISESLLDFETSISSQFEYQALTGKQINLDSARQLALQGDIAGAAKEVVGQFGSLAELQADGPLAMEAAAKAAGMTVDELTKSMYVQETLGDLTKEQQAAMTNLGLSAAELQDMSAEQLQSELAKQQAVDQSAKAFEDIKNTFMTALAPLAESFGQILSGLVPVLRVIGQIISVAFIPIGWAVDAIGTLIDLFKEYAGITTTVLGILGLIWAGQNAALVTETAKNIQYELGFALLVAQEAVQSALVAIQNVGLMGLLRQTAQLAIQGALAVGKAIGSIFSTFAQIPLGIGIPLAFAAVGGMVALYSKMSAKKTGDLAMSAGGGPIVANPREGTIFQGTKNDEVAMGPGVIGAAQRTQPVTMAAQATTSANESRASVAGDQNRILADIANGAKNPAPVQIGTNVIREVNAAIQTENSYNLTPFRR